MAKILSLRYRPRKFADIVGNELALKILTNSLITNNVKSAYFFAGGKGSGKTSTARIFAKAINCTGRAEADPEPCGRCQSCIEVDREVLAGDVMEIDAASQNSVQSIKALVNQIQYAPASGKKRIIILDEVHMLSIAASNALLKTLEEPPEHVVFIFCTTDPQKVVDTVRSRTLYFEFTRLTADHISNRLLEIAASEGIKLDKDAAELVAQSVNGAMRDAITILDQASILSKEVSSDTISRIIGYVSFLDLFELFEALYASKDKVILDWLEEKTDKLDQDIITSILSFVEILVLLNVGADISKRVPNDMIDRIKKLSTVFSLSQLFSIGEIAKATLKDYRSLSLRDSRVLLKLMLVGMLLAREGKDTSAAQPRVALSQLVSSGRAVSVDIAARLKRLFNAEEVSIAKIDVPASTSASVD